MTGVLEKLLTVKLALTIRHALHVFLVSSMMLQLKHVKLAQMDAQYALMQLHALHANLVMPKPHQIHAKLVDQIVLNATPKRHQNALNVTLEHF